jgi:hypothetical protein
MHYTKKITKINEKTEKVGEREPTCGWMVRRIVAPPAHQSLNPGFNTLVSY